MLSPLKINKNKYYNTLICSNVSVGLCFLIIFFLCHVILDFASASSIMAGKSSHPTKRKKIGDCHTEKMVKGGKTAVTKPLQKPGCKEN